MNEYSIHWYRKLPFFIPNEGVEIIDAEDAKSALEKFYVLIKKEGVDNGMNVIEVKKI